MATRKTAGKAPAAPTEVRRFKPLPEEFLAEGDFDQMAAKLGRGIDEIKWEIVDETIDEVDGHTLVATIKE